ncbi:MAG: copper-translocating P-type ATPase [Oligoflexia bacterium]|nr:copper-translocating P-type ATPase [Oligoflexia bacterium]
MSSKIEPNLLQKNYSVQGMSCASCASNIQNKLSNLNGVIVAEVNFPNKSLRVEFDSNVITEKDIQLKVKSLGYDLSKTIDINFISSINHNQENEWNKQYRKLKINTLSAIFLSIPIVIMSMFLHEAPVYSKWLQLILASIVLFVFGRSFFINAFKQTIHLSANMDSLVALSTGIAFFYSMFNTIYPTFLLSRGLTPHIYYEAAVVIISFILLGRTLEEKAKSKTSSAIRKLINLTPHEVTRIQNGVEKKIKLDEILISDKLLIKPGERIAVDGTIESGESFIDESAMSGESTPVKKKMGQKVFAGTLNQNGSFILVAEKLGADTNLGKIIKLVQEAQSSKAPVQKIVDKIALIFVPTILVISILTFIGWSLLGGEKYITQGLMAMITVLIIACPCALGLATPTAIMVGIGKGAEQGILIKNAEGLELIRKVDTIIFDKTGTLTIGKPEISNIIWTLKETSSEEISRYKSIIYEIEKKSEHPLASAIVDYFEKERDQKKENIKPVNVNEFNNIPGAGVSANFQNKNYVVGNKKILASRNINLVDVVDGKIIKEIESVNSSNKSIVYFADDNKVLAIIFISDQLKPSAKNAIAILKEMGITPYLLTGDNKNIAETIASELAINNYQAEVSPLEKFEFVRKLKQKNKIVAMVGDGINDSLALAEADVSIAMGKGSDIAIDVAQMTLLSSDLLKIPEAIKLSKKTVATIKQNLFWAFIYNILAVPIAAGILYPVWPIQINPMIAGATMAFSSVSVVLNSLRLKISL